MADSLLDGTIILQKRRQTTPSKAVPRGSSVVVVRQRPGNITQGLVSIGGTAFPCALGRAGISTRKREGDGTTPHASMHPYMVFFRADRRRSGIGPLRLPAIPIRAHLGWCDAPLDARYNRPVRLPFAASHEAMFREDRLYDVCIVLDWNIRPRTRGRGSAIFLHLARPGMKPTEGCIAVSPRTMARLLPLLSRKTRIIVTR